MQAIGGIEEKSPLRVEKFSPCVFVDNKQYATANTADLETERIWQVSAMPGDSGAGSVNTNRPLARRKSYVS